jgi:hypothetical protein
MEGKQAVGGRDFRIVEGVGVGANDGTEANDQIATYLIVEGSTRPKMKRPEIEISGRFKLTKMIAVLS